MEYLWDKTPLFCSHNNPQFLEALELLRGILQQSLELSTEGQAKGAKKFFADSLSQQFPPNYDNRTDIDYDTLLDGPLANEFEYLFEKMIGILREIRQEEVEYDYDFDRRDFQDRLEKVSEAIDDLEALY